MHHGGRTQNDFGSVEMCGDLETFTKQYIE